MRWPGWPATAASARAWLERSVDLGEEYELHYFVAHALFSLALLALDEDDVRGSALGVRPRGGLGRPQRGAGRRGPRRPSSTAWCAAPRATRRPPPRRSGRAADANRDLDLAADLRECRACLAGALLDAGREQEAADVAREVVGPVVAGGDARGGVEPGRPLLECGRVLAAVGDPLAAEVAAAAGRLLDERADLVGDPDLRAGFLGTPVSRAIARLAGRSAGGARPAQDDVVADAD